MDETNTQASGTEESGRARKQMSRRYKVRKVTAYQASWTEGGRGADGAFTLQLILDNGGEACILEPTEIERRSAARLLGRRRGVPPPGSAGTLGGGGPGVQRRWVPRQAEPPAGVFRKEQSGTSAGNCAGHKIAVAGLAGFG